MALDPKRHDMQVVQPADCADYLHGDMPQYEDGQWNMAGQSTNVNALPEFTDYYDLEDEGGAPGPVDYEEDSGY